MSPSHDPDPLQVRPSNYRLISGTDLANGIILPANQKRYGFLIGTDQGTPYHIAPGSPPGGNLGFLIPAAVRPIWFGVERFGTIIKASWYSVGLSVQVGLIEVMEY